MLEEIASVIFGGLALAAACAVLLMFISICMLAAGYYAKIFIEGWRDAFPENKALVREQAAHAKTKEELTSQINAMGELFGDQEYLEELLRVMRAGSPAKGGK